MSICANAARRYSLVLTHVSIRAGFVPRSLKRVLETRRAFRSSKHGQSGRTIFSGIQPTGVPHIGNYLGAIQQWVRLQDEAGSKTKIYYSVVDLHAITVQQDAEQLRKWKKGSLAALLAAGLNPDRCTIFSNRMYDA